MRIRDSARLDRQRVDRGGALWGHPPAGIRNGRTELGAADLDELRHVGPLVLDRLAQLGEEPKGGQGDREEVPGSCGAGRDGDRADGSRVGTEVVGQVVAHPERVAPAPARRSGRSGEAGPATALQVARRVVDASQELLEPLVAGGIPGARVPGDGLCSPARGLASGAQLLEEGEAIEHIAVKARDGLGDRLLRVHLWTFAHDTRADHPPKVRVGERARFDQSPGWLPERISKRPNRPVAGIQAGMTRSTCAEIGPRASASSNASSAARGPSATQTTAPSARFATQPRSSRRPAASITNQRYPTPCTAPTTVASSRSAAGRPSSDAG